METKNNITTPHVENYKPHMNPVFKIFLISACVCILSVATYAIIYYKDSKAPNQLWEYGSSCYDKSIIENPIVTDIRQERPEDYEDGLRKTVFISFPSCFVLLLIIWVIKRASKK